MTASAWLRGVRWPDRAAVAGAALGYLIALAPGPLPRSPLVACALTTALVAVGTLIGVWRSSRRRTGRALGRADAVVTVGAALVVVGYALTRAGRRHLPQPCRP